LELAGARRAESGELVLAEESVRGIAVHVAARIVAAAEPGETLVSRVTRDLTEGGTHLTFVSRGRHHLKGVEPEVELFAVAADVDAG
jgi:class 3 adenylate cyclase